MRYNYLDDRWKVRFPVPSGLDDLMRAAERADRCRALGEYWAAVKKIREAVDSACGLSEKERYIIRKRFV